MKKLLLGLAVGAGVLFSTAQADDLSDAFDGLFAGNRPGIYNSQVKGYASLGGVDISIPSRSVQLISITPPSVYGGCGGISMFLGGFSYISKDQAIKMLSSIATAAVAYTFILGLRVLCPICSTVLTDLQKVAQIAAELAFNTCQAGQALINYGLDKLSNGSAKDYISGKKSIYQDDGSGGSSWFDNYFGSQGQVTGWLSSFKSNLQKYGNYGRVNSMPAGNVTLRYLNGFSPELKEFFMSLLGVTYYYPGDDAGKKDMEKYVQAPSINAETLMNVFLYGGDAVVNSNVKLVTTANESALTSAIDGNFMNIMSDAGDEPKLVPLKQSFWYRSAGSTTNSTDFVLKHYGTFGLTYAILYQALYNVENNVPLSTGVNVTLPAQFYPGGVTIKSAFTEEQITNFVSIQAH